MNGPDPFLEDLYGPNGEYYDLITGERARELATRVRTWVDTLGPDDQPIVELGPGTGRLLIELAKATDREIFAVEPARSLRVGIAARLADHRDLLDRITVLPVDLGEARAHLPTRLGGVVMLGVLPHLGPDDRSMLFDLLTRRLEPQATALVEVMPPWSAEPVPYTPMGTFPAGRHTIDCAMQADPAGEDRLDWTMHYRRLDEHGATLHEVRAPGRCWVLSPDRFEQEAADHGLATTWPADDLAVLRHRS